MLGLRAGQYQVPSTNYQLLYVLYYLPKFEYSTRQSRNQSNQTGGVSTTITIEHYCVSTVPNA